MLGYSRVGPIDAIETGPVHTIEINLEEPAVQAVGRGFTRAIERWEIEHPRESDDLKGYTVRPHMRRAHPHLYWTGEGRALPRVRFLLPISVKGGKLVEEPETPRVTTVR